MPNYIDNSDNWHLFLPMLGFCVLLIIEIIWSIVKMFKAKKKVWHDLITLITVLFCFANLNNPKGNAQDIGYIGLILIVLVLALLHFLKKRK
jgi:hypothetical membrane protein